MSAKYPALDWGELGLSIQADLGSKGLDAAWFSSKGKDADLRRTVLNLYVKMAGMRIVGKRLWDFVGKQSDVTKGRLEFTATPHVEVFMHALDSSGTFTKPGIKAMDNWDSREFVAKLQLHFKHFSGWKDKDRVEVHIDPEGLYSGPGIGRANVFQMLAHACSMEDYQKVDDIQDKLIQAGWGKTVLNK